MDNFSGVPSAYNPAPNNQGVGLNHSTKEKVPEKPVSPLQDDSTDYFRPSIDRIRFVLMIFLSIQLFGFPSKIGGYFSYVCGFVPIAFFIISGYLVLRETPDREKRILRAIKRTALTFVILAAVYLLLNAIYYKAIYSSILPAFSEKRVWFDFIVLNIWPFEIGNTIWYVQALLYAYIFIFILEKLRLLRFDWIIALLFLIPTVLTGELSGLINFNLLGYSYIMGNFFTRAIPYVLIGCAIHRRKDLFYRLHRSKYYNFILLGAALSVAEIVLLNLTGFSGYYGHLLGLPVMAISVTVIALKDKNDYSHTEKRFLPNRMENRVFYYLLQPVGIAVSTVFFIILGYEKVEDWSGFVGIASFILCYVVVIGVKHIRRRFFS